MGWFLGTIKSQARPEEGDMLTRVQQGKTKLEKTKSCASNGAGNGVSVERHDFAIRPACRACRTSFDSRIHGYIRK